MLTSVSSLPAFTAEVTFQAPSRRAAELDGGKEARGADVALVIEGECVARGLAA